MKALLIAVCLAFAARISQAAPPDEDPLCGPGIVTIGDAWEFISAERPRMKALLSGQDLSVWPQRMAAIAAHANFIHTKAYFLFGESLTDLEAKVQKIRDSRLTTMPLALAGQRDALAASWKDVEQTLDGLAELLPGEALIPTSKLAHILPPAAPSIHVSVTSPSALKGGHPVKIRFTAQQGPLQGRSALLPEHLVETHGARMHAFVVDESVSDYHHVHPEPSSTPGEYVLGFTPVSSGRYRCWINLVPATSGREEFPHVDLQELGPALRVPMEARDISRHATGEDLQAVLLEFGEPITVNTLTPGSIRVTDKTGSPIDDLEPYMGAFAHIVAIHEDFMTVLHIHPHGAVPKADDRGGPVIDFTLRAPWPGYYKLYVQVKRKGRVILLPFGVMAR